MTASTAGRSFRQRRQDHRSPARRGPNGASAGTLAIAAGPLSVLGSVLGLLLVGFDAENFRDLDGVLGNGVAAARRLRSDICW